MGQFDPHYLAMMVSDKTLTVFSDKFDLKHSA